MVCEHEYMNISPPIIELATALGAFKSTTFKAIFEKPIFRTKVSINDLFSIMLV
jgi:hypothetical protein